MSRGAQVISQLQKLPWALLLILGILSACYSMWVKRIKNSGHAQAKTPLLKEANQDNPQEPPESPLDHSRSTVLLRDVIIDDYVDRNVHKNVEVPQACEFDPF
jgi:hypothetical protein